MPEEPIERVGPIDPKLGRTSAVLTESECKDGSCEWNGNCYPHGQEICVEGGAKLKCLFGNWFPAGEC